MNNLEITDEQLTLIQQSLDFYSRVGAGQFTVIKDHPSFQRNLEDICRPEKEIEVDDKTPQGKVLEVKGGKALIDGSVVDGRWNKKSEWKKIEDVKLSTDYTRYHSIRDVVDNRLSEARNTLINDFSVGTNGNWGIYNKRVDDTCRMAFDIVQVIRHERYKQRGDNSHTVDSSVHFSHTRDSSSNMIKCILTKINKEDE
tara:strand:+ start:38 stop:634 length:597 start_codon:yes stop_codon:yes gene_type:complete